MNNPKNEKYNLSETERDVLLQLENLGLKPEEIQGEVLDVGAGEASLAKHFSGKEGVHVTSIDNFVDEENKANVIPADVRDLPFQDGVYDFVISHASMPNVLSEYDDSDVGGSKTRAQESMDLAFDEMIRVLKPGGQIRLAPVKIAGNYPVEKIGFDCLKKTLKRLQQNGLEITPEYITTQTNPDNGETSESYRLVIKKLKNAEQIKKPEEYFDPAILEAFNDERFVTELPEDIKNDPQLRREMIINSSIFAREFHNPNSKIFGRDISVPETAHGDGRVRPSEQEPQIMVDELRKIGIDPDKILMFRRTQPTGREHSNPEIYWTFNPNVVAKGTKYEIKSEQRESSVVLIDTLGNLSNGVALMRDQDRDSIRRLTMAPYNQEDALAVSHNMK